MPEYDNGRNGGTGERSIRWRGVGTVTRVEGACAVLVEIDGTPIFAWSRTDAPLSVGDMVLVTHEGGETFAHPTGRGRWRGLRIPAAYGLASRQRARA